MSANFKVESGVQLLARLQKKPGLNNFYTVLFESGLLPGEIIEICSNDNSSWILIDIITEALIPSQLGGVEAGVLVYNTDGNLNFELLTHLLRKKIIFYLHTSEKEHCSEEELNKFLQHSLSNLSVLEIYDATQLYTSLHSLDSFLMEKPNISIVIFDTLTAFYWSEQGFKVTKMDVYLKTLLKMINKITKECKVTIMYTRPENFTSNKKLIENLEGFCDHPATEFVNYQIQILGNDDDGTFQIIMKTFTNLYKKKIKVTQDQIQWL